MSKIFKPIVESFEDEYKEDGNYFDSFSKSDIEYKAQSKVDALKKLILFFKQAYGGKLCLPGSMVGDQIVLASNNGGEFTRQLLLYNDEIYEKIKSLSGMDPAQYDKHMHLFAAFNTLEFNIAVNYLAKYNVLSTPSVGKYSDIPLTLLHAMYGSFRNRGEYTPMSIKYPEDYKELVESIYTQFQEDPRFRDNSTPDMYIHDMIKDILTLGDYECGAYTQYTKDNDKGSIFGKEFDNEEYYEHLIDTMLVMISDDSIVHKISQSPLCAEGPMSGYILSNVISPAAPNLCKAMLLITKLIKELQYRKELILPYNEQLLDEHIKKFIEQNCSDINTEVEELLFYVFPKAQKID